MIFSLWNNHATFFLKYGLQDKRTKTLNFFFLFVLLFYIYPLKYLFSYIGSVQLINTLGSLGFRSEAFLLAVSKTKEAALSVDDWEDIMIRFGIALLIIHGSLLGMYLNAFQKKSELRLNLREQFETKTSIWAFIILMLISVLSISVVLIGGGFYSGYSGLVYLLVPITLVLLKKLRTKKMNELYPLKKFVKHKRQFANKNSTVESVLKHSSAKENIGKNKPRPKSKKLPKPSSQSEELKINQPKAEQKKVNKNNKTEE